MPCTELFAEQADGYRASVLPAGIPTVSVEAGVTFGWARWADTSIGIDRFGASAPGEQAMAGLGITPVSRRGGRRIPPWNLNPRWMVR